MGLDLLGGGTPYVGEGLDTVKIELEAAVERGRLTRRGALNAGVDLGLAQALVQQAHGQRHMLGYVVVHIEARAGLVRIQDTDFDHGLASRGFSKSRNILQQRLWRRRGPGGGSRVARSVEDSGAGGSPGPGVGGLRGCDADGL